MGIFSALIPPQVQSAINWAVDHVESALKAEPALVIGNGAAVVIWLVANTMGRIPDMTFEQALGAASAAIVTVNAVLLTIRKYVYSPATVDAMQAEDDLGEETTEDFSES